MNRYDAYAAQDTQFSATVTLRVSGTPSGAAKGRTDYWTLSVYEACDLVENLGRALAMAVAPRRTAPELRLGDEEYREGRRDDET